MPMACCETEIVGGWVFERSETIEMTSFKPSLDVLLIWRLKVIPLNVVGRWSTTITLLPRSTMESFLWSSIGSPDLAFDT